MRTLALLVTLLALVGCDRVHVAPPASDAGVVGDASPTCIEWRQRANPEDVYCARWSSP